METINIKITGDLVIDNNYHDNCVDDEIVKLFSASDFNIVNLECPVTMTGDNNKIIKTGPYIKGLEEPNARILSLLNVHLATLANNHIMDYGSKGLSDTLDFCKRQSIATVGAGLNFYEAYKPHRITIKGKVFSIINFAENEWASASSETGGANPMNIIDNVQQIQQEKKEVDFVIVIIHGGHEYYNLPSPRMVKQYRFYAENGANIIVGHHTHCINGFEEYNGVPIYYSLGNFIFTKASKYEDWYLGTVLNLEIREDNSIVCSLIPLKQNKQDYSIKLLESEEKDKVFDRINTYSNIITNKDLLNKNWDSFLERNYNNYLDYFSPLTSINVRYVKGILKKIGIFNLFRNKSLFQKYLNLIRCEAHSDVSKGIITKFLNR